MLRIAFCILLAPFASAQLSGSVGPTTPLSDKSTLCNILDYGGNIGSSDIGPAIQKAFDVGTLVRVPNLIRILAGDYDMQTWVTLTGGSSWAFRLDGLITRTATTGGNMIAVENAYDFEFYSKNSAGGIQGAGYQCRNDGPRLIRMVTSERWSLHDLILVDSPEFHLVIQQGSGGEVYNLAIRGADIGGSDGVDVWGENYWIHDVEVTNRDECVTVKSPASNILVERIWCNQSGGSAMGSLGANTSIANILYQNVYTVGGNQAYMIKSNGGSGTVKDVVFQDFISRDTAYGLNVNQYWASESTQPGDGIQLYNITFKNWDGNVADGVQRSPIQILCADGAPCYDINLDDVYMWSLTDEATWKCESAYGTGACLKSGSSHKSYAVETTTYTQPSGYTTPTTMSGDLTAGFGSTTLIPTPTIPTMFYPGLPQISPLMKNK
ncbi:rhamnogalacturonase-like protein [Postia placenta Mad-698-R]|uniref:Glycoside hydrolase family 28 protein n=1 Tax=Postia placenta MAD-698-R-SB12 TaxID=670580 RepID=A0A1X6N232_9APHY|nr:glycoside hydrolase family 28 protein [Postia placenta MAD-698-R-SB12]EED79070.1 rhamnogalacturonase-like protein [Postia placenta Mad-698-R]OSX62513.1 glycoside hydrolase family 28 protein [Postia placenta MAD-698-R-SB12]